MLVQLLLTKRQITAVALNNGDKDSNLVLSGGNLTLVQGGSNLEAGVRANYYIPRGRWYWEAQANAVNAAVAGAGIGIANSTQPLSNPNFIGDSLNSIAWFDGGKVWRNGINAGTMQNQVSGQRLRVAYDNSIPGSEVIWFDRNGGVNTWINGTGDPQDRSTGYDCSSLNAGPYFPAAMVYTNGDGYTMVFNAKDWLYLPPINYQMLPI